MALPKGLPKALLTPQGLVTNPESEFCLFVTTVASDFLLKVYRVKHDPIG